MKSRDIRDRVAPQYRHCFDDDFIEALLRLNARQMADYLEWLMADGACGSAGGGQAPGFAGTDAQ